MKVALVRGKNAGTGACAEAEQLFRRMGCATFWTTAAEHDLGVGFAQSLNFTVSAAFFCSLARNRGIRPFFTPSFKRHLEAARKHLTTDKKMFCEFTSLNPAFQKALEEYQGILAEVAVGGLSKIADEAALWYAEEAK
jgi:prephenate dehydrogenase